MRPRKPAVLKMSEDELHRAVAEFLDLALYPSTVWTTFPAGWGKFGVKTAVRLKASGLKPGMPDVWIIRRCDDDSSYVVCIELKKPGEKPSASQNLMFPRLRQVGVVIHVCSSVDEVIAALREEQVPLRIHQWQDERLEPRKRLHDATSARPDTTGDADGAAQRQAR